MPQIIRSYNNRNKPIVNGGPITPLIYFNLLHLSRGQEYHAALADFEMVQVVLKGQCEITIDNTRFDYVGQRLDIWSGNADSVYAGAGAQVKIVALKDETEVADDGGA